MSYNNELYHYGVLGMKWGVHRAKKNVQKAKNRRDSAKEWDEIAKDAKSKGKTKQAAKYKKYAATDRAVAKKYDAKSKAIIEKHERRAGKKTLDRVKAQSTGKLVAKSMLMGTYGTLKYEQARAKNASVGKAAVRGVLYSIGNNLTYGVGQIVEPRLTEGRHR